ncbi:hypothetical protein [Domibacillus epiphyticus]|uniref:Uncharacterized protein n=1 Tax=Domibacillus epiphyticus TaxID=1714355 RepID=A0A1V2A4F7_9BACI|nr:hypothetical protein [Domibacillus epiphyticus]OMP65694.1 hypothetical protein BTO28_16195 [Domibacillus epiphyticus]
MEQVFIISAVKAGMKPGQTSIVLELSSDQDGKSAYRYIRKQLPKASLGVFVSKGEEPFRRSQRPLKHSRLVYNISDFLHFAHTNERKKVM